MRNENAISVDLALRQRAAGLGQAAERWGRLSFAAALVFVAQLYANPVHWFPAFESARLGLVAAAVCAFALAMRRITSGEPIHAGGPFAGFLYAYLAIIPLSLLWTIHVPATQRAVVEAAKLVVVFVAIQSVVDSTSRLRTLFLVASLASLAPSLGGIRVWLAGEELVEGFRTHWYGVFRDPNRLAMNLIVVMPMTLALLAVERRHWLKPLLGFTVAVQLAAIVLTHSRSGAVGTVLAAGLFMLRGGLRNVARSALLALVLGIGVVAFAPQSFWDRSSTITTFAGDASVAGRERAWQLLGVIWDERPLSGVGAGAFVHAWDTYAPLSALGGRHLVAHNIFMEILGELGIVALLAFFAFVAFLVARLFVAGRAGPRGLEARAIFAALSGYMLVELVNGYSLSPWLYVLFACAAVALRLHGTQRVLAAHGTSS